jgi:hypothetical protein
MSRSNAACALAGALWLCAAPGAVRAAAPPPAAPSGECVTALRNVHAGSGEKTFASAYVFSNDYAYGEWAAGVARGQSLWRKRGTSWCKVQTGTDALDERALEGYGVPGADAHRLIAQMTSSAQIAPPERPPERSKDVEHR